MGFKARSLGCALIVAAAVLLAPGCGYYGERRAIHKGKKMLSQKEKKVEELEELRGSLKRIVDMKLQSASLLESVNRLLGRKYMESGNYHLAEEVLLEAEYLLPHNGFIKKDIGECYYFLGISTVEPEKKARYFDDSRSYYTKALDLEPDLLEAKYGLGILLFFGYENVFDAIDIMKEILEEEPGHVEAHFALGRFYYEIDELGKALGEYIELTKILQKGSSKRKKADENILKINRELGADE